MSAQAGIHVPLTMDSRLRGNDGEGNQVLQYVSDSKDE